MELFIGFDVSLASTAICVLDDHGKIVKEVKVSSEPEGTAKLFEAQDHPTGSR